MEINQTTVSAVVSFALGVFGGLLANYISPPFGRWVQRLFSRLFHILNPDRFDLTGKWEQKFKEPTPEDTSIWRETRELVDLRHLGAVVSGSGETQDDKRRFRYDLNVQHNLVFGSYVKIGAKGNITGNGMIQLIVSPDRVGMKGQATWFDSDTSQIESSVAVWTKIA
jgi:hypothetical protein